MGKDKGRILSQEIKTGLKLITGIKLDFVSAASLSEKEFFAEIRELESNALFMKLASRMAWGRVFSRNPGRAEAARCFFGEESEYCAGYFSKGMDMDGADRFFSLMRRIGRKKLEKYFLSEYPSVRREVISECGISGEEYDSLRAFLAVFLNFYENRFLPSAPEKYFSTVAEISIGKKGLEISYLGPVYPRGLYRIDESALERAKKRLSKEEAAVLPHILRKVRKINWRKSALMGIVEGLVEYQRDYISGKGPLKPLSIRRFARDNGLDHSIVSRIAGKKSVVLPGGKEVPLRSLFRKTRDFIIDIIDGMGEKAEKLSDREISEKVKEACGISVSRRSVNLYRGKRRGK